jgi:hypothetical protein
MFSEMHPELDPLGSYLRKQIICRGRKESIDLVGVSDVVVHRYQTCAGVGDKDLVYFVDAIVESY